jgi:hypothetical protein
MSEGREAELRDAYAFRLPKSYNYAGYVWPGIVLSPGRLRQMRHFQLNSTDVLIASYPKSGTTWASELVSLICHRGNEGLVEKKPLHERVPWLELDQGFMWVRFFWLWQIMHKVLGLEVSKTTEPSSSRTGISRRIFFHSSSFGIASSFCFGWKL